MILVTGAAGKTGRAVIKVLKARKKSIRALVHRDEQVSLVKHAGADEAVVGDMRLPEVMEQATRGVQALYHICPNATPDETAIGQTAIAAAKSSGVEHFVYHSVLHPQTEKMPHHWQKLRVEECLLESDLPYTVLQPAIYMQNILANWTSIVEQGIYPIPYAAETRLSTVDLEDVAAAAAVVLTEAGHKGATYELCGAAALSQIETSEIIGRCLGRPVRVKVEPIASWKAGAAAVGLSDEKVAILVKMFIYYERYGFVGNCRVLEWLLGRPATTYEAFIERTIRELA